jgi:hypothetical protein
LLSLTVGSMRMVLLSQLGPKGEMRGLITTLGNPMGSVFIPASAPIVYLKSADTSELELGYLRDDCSSFESYRAVLKETLDRSYVAWGEP